MPRNARSGAHKVKLFNNLSIVDFEEGADDAFGNDISDLESVIDLPDDPQNNIQNVERDAIFDSPAAHPVDVSKPNTSRAVYSVPTVVNFQNWESKRMDAVSDEPTPLMKRVLILKNVDVCPHAAVVSAPLTPHFGMFGRSSGESAPFQLLLQPGASFSFNVCFYQPDEDLLELWDNFRDAIVVYTERCV